MGPCRLLKTIFAQFLGKYRVVSALFGKIERLTFTGTFDAFQYLVKSHSFKQICFPHRSEMGVLKSFPYIHLYRLVGHEDATAQLISENADEIIRLKDAKRSVPKDLWAAYSRFVVSVRDKNGKERWVRNS